MRRSLRVSALCLLAFGGVGERLRAEDHPTRPGEPAHPAAQDALLANGHHKVSEKKQDYRTVQGTSPTSVADSLAEAARAAAQSALAAARKASIGPHQAGSSTVEKAFQTLPLEGKPGDVRLVCLATTVIQRSRWIVPRLPFPPFSKWNRWLDEHPSCTHCVLDWMDEHGQWWHTELRGLDQYDAKYRVGMGEFRASGVTIYGVFIVPGRNDPEGLEVISDEKIDCDFKLLDSLAREYARKDKHPGDPGTGGKGERNVGLGGPAWRPSCNSNTFIHYLLKRAGVEHGAPQGAVGWDTVPRFPYSSNADAYER